MIKNILLIIVSFMLTIFFCEYGLRILGHQPLAKAVTESDREIMSEVDPKKRWALDDEDLGWINRPGVYQSAELNSSKMTFTEDSERLTVRPSGYLFKQPSVDWLLVGCSFTQGYSVPDSGTFSSFLNERFPLAKIHNFGTGGYSTYQSLLRTEKIFRSKDIKPNLVIYGFIGDHLPRNVATLNWVKAINSLSNGMMVHPHVTIDRDGTLVRHQRRIENVWPLETNLSIVGFIRRALIAFDLTGREPLEVAVTSALITEMDALVKANNAKFLVVILDDPNVDVMKFLKSSDIDYLMCVNPAGKIPPSYRVAEVGHPNQLQHKLWANCIGDWIARNQAIYLQN
jgi:hypothetical protein